MRIALTLMAVALLLPPAVRADDPLTKVMTQQPATVVEAPPVIVSEGEWFTSPRTQPCFGIDIMFGQQSGIRPTLAVYSTERSALVVEAFYGAIFTKFGQSEGAGAGVRWLCSRGGCNSVTFGPGCDVLFNFQDGEAIFLAPTVDLAWRHNFGDRASFLLGINAGIGVGLSGGDDDRRRRDAAGRVTPLISVFSGLRF